MARRYSVVGTDTNTAATTMLGVTSAATVRPAIYELVIGSIATPADNAWDFFLQRYTVAGTSTAFTPVALDPADPASLASAGVNHSVEPTYTANAYLGRFSGNQRATFRWVANPGSELKMPATAANGIGLLSQTAVGSAVAMTFTIYFEE